MLGVHELLHDGNPSITEVEQEMVVIRVEFARRVHATRGGFDRHAIAFRRHVQDLEMQAFRERLEKARGHCGDRFPGVPARDQDVARGRDRHLEHHLALQSRVVAQRAAVERVDRRLVAIEDELDLLAGTRALATLAAAVSECG